MNMKGKKTKGVLAKIVPVILALVMALSLGTSAVAGVVDGSIVVGDDHNTGYAPDSEAHGGYTLDGPVLSGERSVFDAAANDGDGGDIVTEDLAGIDKQATFDESTGEGTVTLTIDATKPVRFSHFPPPRMDYVLVVDLTTSMTQPLRSNTNESNWQKFWDERTRIYQTREAIKEASQIIWDANPGSTITIVPFAGGGSGANYLKGVLKPNSTGDYKGFDYGAFSPSSGSFSTTNTSTDPAITQYVHMPTSGPLSNPANYTSVAANKSVTDNYRYYKLTRSDVTDADFSDSIDALPLASNTSTAAGATAALDILQSGALEATNKENRVTILITDGGANVTDNTTYANSRNLYTQAAEKMSPICADIKDPTKGNSTLSVVSIFPVPIIFNAWDNDLYMGTEGNTGKYAIYSDYTDQGVIEWTAETANRPGGQAYTKPTDVGDILDVQNGPYGMCTNWAETPAHYYGADDSGQAVYDAISDSVRESVDFHAGFKGYLEDALNTQYFEMDMTVDPTIKVSINGGPELSPGDIGFPSAIDVEHTESGVVADLGTMPYGDILTAGSKSTVTITYAFKIKDDIGAHFSELHTNIDDQTFFEVTNPRHDDPTSNVANYTDEPFYMPFPTPIITLDDDPAQPHLILQKVDENGAFLARSVFGVSASGVTPLEVSPVDAAGEEFVIAPNTEYTISELASPSGYQTLSGNIVITTDGDGVPTLTQNPDNAAALSVTSVSGDPVRATLVVTNTPGGGGGDEDEFKKLPSTTNVRPGQTVDYTFSGFGNSLGKTLTNYAITDFPPQGLDFVSASIPAFTNGSGLTYSVKYRTNQRDNVTLRSGIPADSPQTISAPTLNPGEQITALVVAFDQVPAGFGMGDTMKYTFRVWNNPPTPTLTNRAGLSYEVDGQPTNREDPGTPIVVNGGGSTSSNTATGDNGMVPLIAAALLVVACVSEAIIRRKNEAN